MKVAIMTCPQRLRGTLLSACYSQNLPGNTEIFCDEECHGPAWNLECMFTEFIKRKEDVLVIQDDLIIEPWFMDEIQKSLIPGELMTYCINTSLPLEYYKQGYSYARVFHTWGQANYFPLWFMKAYFEWTKYIPPLPEKFKVNAGCALTPPIDFAYRVYGLDDASITACLLWMGKKAVLTLPNLVQHDVASVSTQRDRNPADFKSHVFGTELLRPWDKNKIVDMPPVWVLQGYIHPLRVGDYPIEVTNNPLATGNVAK